MIQDVLIGLSAVLLVTVILLAGSIWFDENDWKKDNRR